MAVKLRRAAEAEAATLPITRAPKAIKSTRENLRAVPGRRMNSTGYAQR